MTPPDTQLPSDELIQDWIAYAKRGIPDGEVAMTTQVLNSARVMVLGNMLLKAKRLLEEKRNE